MKTFRIEETFTGYAEITIEAETEEEAMALYNSGDILIVHTSGIVFAITINFNKYQRYMKKKQNQLTTIREHKNENNQSYRRTV